MITQLEAMGAGPGSDYLRLAESLLELADLYQRYAGELAGDVRRNRPGDRELAGRLGEELFASLYTAGRSPRRRRTRAQIEADRNAEAAAAAKGARAARAAATSRSAR